MTVLLPGGLNPGPGSPDGDSCRLQETFVKTPGATKLDLNLEVGTWWLEKEVAERVTSGGAASFEVSRRVSPEVKVSLCGHNGSSHVTDEAGADEMDEMRVFW